MDKFFTLYTTDISIASILWLWIIRMDVIQFLCKRIQTVSDEILLENPKDARVELSYLIPFLKNLSESRTPLSTYRILGKILRHSPETGWLNYSGMILTMGAVFFDGFVHPLKSDRYPDDIHNLWKETTPRSLHQAKKWMTPIIKKSRDSFLVGGIASI